ncbi:hypothetical protein Slin15195_G108480 [Septoria linicola]|uniref:Uncharacterized protein n=1 Tax=Septoria linicola TaxID=215465 RepID=A0A9Q9AY33_9PEZI|nr:hypothetical protein Slin14017_G106780 [Septoria linicola]USW57529.1 hypothetical protein Slin15195_G108480 [Septoria linicola]
MRKESLLLSYVRMSFAFEQRRSYHDRKFWSDVKRPKPKFLEHWLQSRPVEVLPTLMVMFKFSAGYCPHVLEIKANMYGTREDPLATAVEKTITVNDDALVLLELADSRQLRVVASELRLGEGRLALSDCEGCWRSVTEKWQRLADSEDWRRARDQWHDRADAGKLERTDAIRIINLVRDYRWNLTSF